MSVETDQQRGKRLDDAVDSLQATLDKLSYESRDVISSLTIEVNHWRNVCVTKEKELAGLKIENSGLVSAVESIAADRKAIEGHFNEKVEELFAADEKLKSEIFWRSILFWLMALLAVIILIAGVLK